MKLRSALLLGLIGLAAVACERVPQGTVGIKVHTLGNSKGPDEELLTMGRYWVSPSQEVHLFPVFTQNYVWGKSEESGHDESIVFQDNQGLTITADVGVEFDIDPDKVVVLFQKYRRGINEIIDQPLRNVVRDAFVARASKMSVEHIYGGGKTELIAQVQEDVKAYFAPFGVNVQKVYWVGEMHIPQSVKEAVNAKVRATQTAIQRENELRKAEADAAMRVAEAKGHADALIEEARGRATAIALEGEALRENPEILDAKKIERWNGQLPRVVTSADGAVPFINIDPDKK